MTSKLSFNIIDYSDEYSKCEFNIVDVDELSWVAEHVKIATLQAAVAGVTIGNIAYRTLVAYKTHVDDSRPSDKSAQREMGLRLFMKDTVTGEKTHVTIPAPDLDILAPGGSDSVDLTISVAAALVGAIEAMIVSKMGNPVTIYKGIIVGRNN